MEKVMSKTWKVSMKQTMAAWVFVLLTALTAGAETAYITDNLKITVRTGKGTDHKIIQMVGSGEPVEVIEPGEDWSKVRLQDGREGYVLTRMLSRQLPLQLQNQTLAEELESLKRKTRDPLAEINRLESENKMLQKALEDLRAAYEDTQASEASLSSKASGLDACRKRLDQALADLASTRDSQQSLEEEVKSLERDRMIRWFLAGAMVLLIGFLLGNFTRSRKRRSFLQ